MQRSLSIVPVQPDMLQRTPPVTWRRWDTLTYGIMPRVNRIGLMQGFRSRASITIDATNLGEMTLNRRTGSGSRPGRFERLNWNIRLNRRTGSRSDLADSRDSIGTLGSTAEQEVVATCPIRQTQLKY